MNHYIYFLLFLTILNVVTAKSTWEDYYWRDYHGIIPTDALKAGDGIYIGQVRLEDGEIIPGKIFNHDQCIYYEYEGQAWTTAQNIKILCTATPLNFEWVPTTVHEVPLLQSQKNLVNGGYEPSLQTFIGRVLSDGKTYVGKVLCRKTNCLGLYANRDGRSKEYQTFEILAYNPDTRNNIGIHQN